MQWYSSGKSDDRAHFNYLVPLDQEAYDDAKSEYGKNFAKPNNNNYEVFRAVPLKKTRNKV